MSLWPETVVVWLVDYYVQASLLLAAAFACLALIRQPARRLAVAWAALASLAALAVLTALPAWPRLAVRPPPRSQPVPSAPSAHWMAVPAPPPTVQANQAAVAGGLTRAPASFKLVITASELRRLLRQHARGSGPQIHTVPADVRMAGGYRDDAAGSPDRATSAAPEEDWRTHWSGVIAGVFLGGCLLALAWIGLGAWQVRRLCRTGRPVPAALQTLLDRVAGGRRRLPRLLVSTRLGQPVALGTWRPAILLPEQAVGAVPEARLEAVLAHEWAHIRHGDLWLLALARWLLPLLFAHPLYWWLRGRLRQDQEARADAAAAGQGGAVEYAAALLHWARLGRKRRTTAAALALWRRQSELKRRITMLLDPRFPLETRCPGRWRWGTWSLTGLAVLALSVLTVRPVPPATAAEPAAKPATAPTKEKPRPAPSAGQPARSIPAKPSAVQQKAMKFALADFDNDGHLNLVLAPPSSAAAAAPRAKPVALKVAGRVVGPDNKPLVGARVAVVTRPAGKARPAQVLGQVRTDAQGRYQLQVNNPAETWSPWSAPGAMAWVGTSLRARGKSWSASVRSRPCAFG